jgi:N-acetylgalactosamine 4-sulfate 6-O-sulfotransferase
MPLIHILGVSKCGTTDLYSRLTRHADFVASTNKGPHFWDECPDPGRSAGGPPHCAFQGYLDLYAPLAAAVAAGNAAAVSADASSNTFTASGVWRRGHSPVGDVSVGELLAEVAPYGRYIIILRDPVDRFFSAFHYYRSMYGPTAGRPPASAAQFHDEAVAALAAWATCLAAQGGTGEGATARCVRRFEPQQLVKGMYAQFLWDWRRLGAQRLLLMRTEDYAAEPQRHLAAVFEFAGMRQPANEEQWAAILDAPRANAAHGRALAQRAAAEPMEPRTRAMLNEFYSPFNRALAEALGDNRFLWGAKAQKL